MTMNKYIGSRYVPLYLGTHDKTKAYEPLSIVNNDTKTKTFTSIKSVPKNITLDNTEYWAQSGYFQDGIVEITPDIAELASFEQPKMTITKTDDNAEISLEVADAYNAGASYGTAYVLNTLTTAGLYIIKPSVCAEVPDAIASVDAPTSLSVITYDNAGATNYMQQINSGDSIYMRTGDGETWETWKETSSGNGWSDIDSSLVTVTNLNTDYVSACKVTNIKVSADKCFIHVNVTFTNNDNDISLPTGEYPTLAKLNFTNAGYNTLNTGVAFTICGEVFSKNYSLYYNNHGYIVGTTGAITDSRKYMEADIVFPVQKVS